MRWLEARHPALPGRSAPKVQQTHALVSSKLPVMLLLVSSDAAAHLKARKPKIRGGLSRIFLPVAQNGLSVSVTATTLLAGHAGVGLRVASVVHA